MTALTAATLSGTPTPSIFQRLIAHVRREMMISRGTRELMKLSDHELDDIGISRYDIPRVVRGGKV